MKESVCIRVNRPTRGTGHLLYIEPYGPHVSTRQRGLSQSMTWLGLRGSKVETYRAFPAAG
jgi:hypothetical protein